MESFVEFVMGSQHRLIHFADLLCGDRDRAADLVQHALIKVYQSWSRLRHSDPEAYARTVIANANIDWWRRRRWLETPTETVDRPGSQDPATALSERDLVLRALNALNPRQRHVIVLRYYCDLSESDIAQEIGCPVGTVKSTSSRALEKLRGNPDLQEAVGGL